MGLAKVLAVPLFEIGLNLFRSTDTLPVLTGLVVGFMWVLWNLQVSEATLGLAFHGLQSLEHLMGLFCLEENSASPYDVDTYPRSPSPFGNENDGLDSCSTPIEGVFCSIF